MEEPAQENQNNAGGAVVVGAGGAENVLALAAAAAAAEQGNNNNNDDEFDNIIATIASMGAAEDDAAATATTVVAAPSSSRYPQRKRKPLLSVQGSGNNITGGSSPSGLVDTSALTDRQFEKLLAQYEADGEAERAQKKLRLERGYGDDDYPYVAPPEGCPPLDSLPKEAVKLVFELLPTVRSVFNLAFQSKHMLSFVDERVSTA